MKRNVEIKAKVNDLQKIILLATQLSDCDGKEIPQHDIFYEARAGRLKLRRYGASDAAAGTLVYYDRPDEGGPKLSEYELFDLSPEQVHKMHTILSKSLGVKGELNKKRRLFMVGQTRVHVDSVEGLGDFVELEVVLRPEQTLEEGQKIANTLQQQLGVKDEDLLCGAYMDLVLKSKHCSQIESAMSNKKRAECKIFSKTA